MPNERLPLRELIRKRIPFARNGMSSKRLHKQRSLYRYLYNNGVNTIDFWHDRTLYGRVDDSGNAVFPSEAHLKEFKGSDCVLALNFVVDAYEDFAEEFIAMHRTNPRFFDHRFLNPRGLIPKRGWLSINKIYHEQSIKLYTSYVNTFLANLERNRGVTTYDKFMRSFLEFVDQVGPNAPLTRTGIITSLSCTPHISGLCVEFALLDHSFDYTKHNDFFMSEFYLSYLKTAEKYGLFVDQNAPWRLIGDISSPGLEPYMANYGVSPENVYEKNFVKSYPLDIPALRIYLKQYYKTLVAAQPSVRVPGGRRISRRPLSDVEYATRYDMGYWIWAYARIRQSEVMEKMSTEEFKEEVKKAIKLGKHVDNTAAIEYINSNYLGRLEPPFKKTEKRAGTSISTGETSRRSMSRRAKASVASSY